MLNQMYKWQEYNDYPADWAERMAKQRQLEDDMAYEALLDSHDYDPEGDGDE